MRGKNSGHVGGFAGPLAKAGSDAGRLGREGKQKLTTAAPAAADGGSAKVASGVEGGFCKNRVR